MTQKTAKITIRLPVDSIDFVERYAHAHRLSVSEVIERYLRRMRSFRTEASPTAVSAISGLLPPDIDADAEMLAHQIRKHLR